MYRSFQCLEWSSPSRGGTEPRRFRRTRRDGRSGSLATCWSGGTWPGAPPRNRATRRQVLGARVVALKLLLQRTAQLVITDGGARNHVSIVSRPWGGPQNNRQPPAYH